jgi:hypothetical protein
LRRTVAGVALAAAALAAALVDGRRVGAGEPTPAERLEREWAYAKDDARRKLLEGVVASPSSAAFAAVREAALDSAGVLVETRAMRRTLGGDDDEPPSLGATPRRKKPPRTVDETSLDSIEARERRAIESLAEAGAKILSALPDEEFGGAVRSAVLATADGIDPPSGEWAAEAVGRARQARTPPLLVAIAAERLAAYRRSLAERAAPAKRLDEVNAKIADLVARFLKAQQEKGDFSGRTPDGLTATFKAQKTKLEREVLEHQKAMDAAQAQRATARRALARLLAGLAPEDLARALELVEKTLLSDPDVDVRAFGIGALSLAPGERAFAQLRGSTADADARIAVAALEALADRTEPDAIGLLAKGLADPRWRVRAASAASLGRTGRAVAVPPLVDALETAEGRTLDDLRDALRALTGRSFAAAAGPWREWWEREGASFRGRNDPEGAAPGAGPVAEAPSESAERGGVSFYGIETHSTRVLFVLDFSGSMNFAGSERDGKRKKVDVLREEMKKTVTGLPDGATFNLVGFASDVRVWRKDPALRSAKTAAAALEWVEKSAVLGSTNIYDALETAFEMMGFGAAKDRAVEPVYDTVFFMTDGKPTSGKVTQPDRILAEVRRWNEARKVRIHVVGMGGHEKPRPDAPGGPPTDDIDPEFLKTLAEQNGGQCVIR